MIQILLSVLLVGISSWPVLGWAGEYTIEKRDHVLTKILTDEAGNAVILECKHGVPCDWTYSAKHLFTCCQRMREAMRRMEAFLRRGVVIPVDEYRQIKELWNATVADCVEGRE